MRLGHPKSPRQQCGFNLRNHRVPAVDPGGVFQFIVVHGCKGKDTGNAAAAPAAACGLD
jgi:hypothetical protein